MDLATMFFSRGVLYGKKKVFQKQRSTVGTIRAGGKIRSGQQVGKGATSPLPSRGSPPLQSGGGGGIRSGPQVGKMATSPLPSRGSPPLQSGGQNQKWPTSGRNGYLTPAVSGIPAALERGAKSEVAHKWAKWLPDTAGVR